MIDDLTLRFATLEHRSKHDGLTGCNTREHLLDVLNTYFQNIQTGGGMCVIMFIDMDNFKLVNDNFGHDVGDKVLQNFITLLKQRLRKNDLIARYGGDEFIAVMNHISLEEASHIARDIVQLASKSYDANEFNVGCSVGISILNRDSVSVIEIIKQADIACYAAKQNIPYDSVCIYNGS